MLVQIVHQTRIICRIEVPVHDINDLFPLNIQQHNFILTDDSYYILRTYKNKGS